jgi:hypothetical protein
VSLNKRVPSILFVCLCSTFRCQHQFNAACDSIAQLPFRAVGQRRHVCLSFFMVVFQIRFHIKRAPSPIPVTEIRCRVHGMQCIRSTMLTCLFNGLEDGTRFVPGAWSFVLFVVGAATMIWKRLCVTGKVVEGVSTAALLHIE